MDFLIMLCAFHSLAFAIVHVCFWSWFDWSTELAKVDPATRAMTQILNLRLIYVLLAVGVFCLAYPTEMRATHFGRAFLVGMSFFWWGRMVEQVFIFRQGSAYRHYLSIGSAAGGALFLAAAAL